MKYLACSPVLIATLLLAGCQNAEFDDVSQEKMSISGCANQDDAVVQSVRDARTEFNRAIEEADIDAVRSILTVDAILVTGTDSETFMGRDAQVDIWASDFADDTSLIYLRSPTCVTLSKIYPIAMEYGNWRGARPADDENFVTGVYSAKWRLIADKWVIEVELYVTSDCGGSLCVPPQVGEK